MIALATRYAVITQVASSWVAPRPPAMCGNETLAMELSNTSMNVASVTVRPTIHGLTRGRHATGADIGCETLGASATLAAAMGCFALDSTWRDPDSRNLFRYFQKRRFALREGSRSGPDCDFGAPR